jgi:penicillin-binding protein 1A
MAFIRSRGLKILLAAIGLLGVAGIGAALAFYFAILRDLPDLRSVSDFRPPLASFVFDREDRLIGEFFSERRRLTPLEAVPRHVVDAFVAGEDSAFFEHTGIDYASILRAAWVNLRAGGEIVQGGSTITQQMVKGLLLSPERRLRRKLREMILARRIEQRFSKHEILYLYLNQIYFGHGAYGIGEAARRYFGKVVGDLSVSEGALLAGMPKAPSRYSPYVDPEQAERRRHYVLSRMLKDEFIDSEIYAVSLAEVPALVGASPGDEFQAAEYFTEELRRYLFEELGSDQVLRGGLIIETTLDLDLQRHARPRPAACSGRGRATRAARPRPASGIPRAAAAGGILGNRA